MPRRAKSGARWHRPLRGVGSRRWTSLVPALALLAVACADDAPAGQGGAAGQGGSGAETSQAGSANAGASVGASGSAPTADNGGVAGAAGTSAGAAGTANQGGSAAGGSGSAGGGSSSGGSSAGSAGTTGTAQAFKGVANSDCADLSRLGVSWWYNWVLSPGSCKASEFVPMIAGKSEKTADAVTTALGKLKAAGYRTVLGFNEPNKTDQSSLSVAQVVELWPALTADPDVRVGSPATSADAKAWFEDFMAQVASKALRVDFVAVHWYGWNAGSCNDAKELEAYITWAEKFKKPIWITEFGCLNESNPSADVVQKFYASALEAFARHSSVERYAWYPWTTNNELVDTGNLTTLGAAFAAAPATR